MASKDKIYFTFKENINSEFGKNKGRYFNIMYHDLQRRTHIPAVIRDHFHQLNSLSPRWWNITHYYIYHNEDVRTLIKSINELV